MRTATFQIAGTILTLFLGYLALGIAIHILTWIFTDTVRTDMVIFGLIWYLWFKVKELEK